MIDKSIFSKYFVVDNLSSGAFPMYAAEKDIACVYLNEEFKIGIESGRRRYLLPRCDFNKFPLETRQPKFDEFVLDLLVESARHNHNFYDSFGSIYNHYKNYDLSFGRVLVPNTGKITEKVNKYAVLTNFLSIDKTKLLNDVAIICPKPEFVGVIAIRDNVYSVGIFNSRAICVLT